MIYGLLLFKMLNTLMLSMLSLIDVTHLHHKEETMEIIREHIFLFNYYHKKETFRKPNSCTIEKS